LLVKIFVERSFWVAGGEETQIANASPAVKIEKGEPRIVEKRYFAISTVNLLLCQAIIARNTI
jgi:hypothetical protein